jgi:hypothetical protein
MRGRVARGIRVWLLAAIGAIATLPSAGAQDRQAAAAAVRAPLTATVVPDAEGSPLVLLIQNPTSGVYQASLAVELRYAGAVVGKTLSGPLTVGQSRKLSVSYVLPRVSSGPVTLEIFVNQSRLATYLVPSRATVSTATVSTTKPTGSVPVSSVQPIGTTAAPSVVLPPRLTEIHYQWYLPDSYKTLKGTQTAATTWTLPVVDKYDDALAPLVKFLWRFDGPKEWIDQAITQRCCIEVAVNDVTLPLSGAGQVSWASPGVIRTAIPFYPFVTSFLTPRIVRLTISHPGQKPFSTSVTILRGQALSYFTEQLYPIFQHERCITCHSLGDAASLKAQHQQSNIHLALNEPYVPGKAPEECKNCHVTDWRTPHASLGIDWRGKSAKEICAIVTQRLPTPESRTHHFHDDPRIVWAASNGVVLGKEKPVLFKNNFPGFLEVVDTWIERGSPCPS